ncbi:R-SNARE protein, VAMP72-family [Scenedesmus sp. NREL 46B-D3]|nr:R-SNARE protein, VAMP72-family [Scenedesmus sp. NREL 46B-D3]
MPLIYSFVARNDNTVLAEYSPYHGNFNTVALECLQHLQLEQNKLTIACDKHTFNFTRREQYVFLVVADEAFGRQIPFAFLERVSDDFIAGFASKGKTAAPHSMDRSFGVKLKQHMDYCTNNPDEISRVAGVQRKVDEVKNIMIENLDKVLERGERIELLVHQTEELRNHAQTFQKQGRALRSNMWWQNMRMKVIVVLVVLLLAVVIFLLACFAGPTKCIKKHSPPAQ